MTCITGPLNSVVMIIMAVAHVRDHSKLRKPFKLEFYHTVVTVSTAFTSTCLPSALYLGISDVMDPEVPQRGSYFLQEPTRGP